VSRRPSTPFPVQVLVRNARQLFEEGYDGPDFLVGHGRSLAPKLGMPVILMPFLISQNNSRGGRTLTTSLRLGGGFSLAEKASGSAPGPA
jgi:hypothetical protein